MDVHPTKNGINRYWPIPICLKCRRLTCWMSLVSLDDRFESAAAWRGFSKRSELPHSKGWASTTGKYTGDLKQTAQPLGKQRANRGEPKEATHWTRGTHRLQFHWESNVQVRQQGPSTVHGQHAMPLNGVYHGLPMPSIPRCSSLGFTHANSHAPWRRSAGNVTGLNLRENCPTQGACRSMQKNTYNASL